MSRNPILTDSAFDPARYGGTATMAPPSPTDEWESAQAAQAAAGGAMAPTGMAGRVPAGRSPPPAAP